MMNKEALINGAKLVGKVFNSEGGKDMVSTVVNGMVANAGKEERMIQMVTDNTVQFLKEGFDVEKNADTLTYNMVMEIVKDTEMPATEQVDEVIKLRKTIATAHENLFLIVGGCVVAVTGVIATTVLGKDVIKLIKSIKAQEMKKYRNTMVANTVVEIANSTPWMAITNTANHLIDKIF